MSQSTALHLAIFILLSTLLCCGAESGEQDILEDITISPTFELAGEWETSTGEQAFISDTMWGLDSILSFDNTENYVFTQTASNAAGGANAYNKIVWTDIVNDSFYACYALFGYASLVDLERAAYEVDSSDPEVSGCNGMPWFLFVRTESSTPNLEEPLDLQNDP